MMYQLRWWLLRLLTARPDPARVKRCCVCRDWSPIFVDPCPVCGCTGEAEYKYKLTIGNARRRAQQINDLIWFPGKDTDELRSRKCEVPK
jgi:hypothetical protein